MVYSQEYKAPFQTNRANELRQELLTVSMCTSLIQTSMNIY